MRVYRNVPAQILLVVLPILLDVRQQSEAKGVGAGPDGGGRREDVAQIRLTRDLLARDRYDTRIRPVVNASVPLSIHISISLYQIIEVDEPAQNIKMNVWMIQKWTDELLDWNPREYDLINKTTLPYDSLWIPDTYLYNSVVMSRDETERYMNIIVESNYWKGMAGANLSFLYPAIYTITCRLNIRYFPYDQQNCTLTISSWTCSKSALDYYADAKVSMAAFIPNEEWDVISFNIYRHEKKYACCAEPWVILQASLIIRRKALFYLVNLVLPTSIITIVAIVGFFTPASTDDDRTEKINLGITTLLAMSILMMMVSDAMPTTSEFVPLIAWFFLIIIIQVSLGTFFTSIVLSIQGRRQYGKTPPAVVRYVFFCTIATALWITPPPQLQNIWIEFDDDPFTVYKRKRRWFAVCCRGRSRRPPAVTKGHTTLPTILMEPADSTGGSPAVPATPSAMSDTASVHRTSIQMIDTSVPPTPGVDGIPIARRRDSLWNSAVTALVGVNVPAAELPETAVSAAAPEPAAVHGPPRRFLSAALAVAAVQSKGQGQGGATTSSDTGGMMSLGAAAIVANAANSAKAALRRTSVAMSRDVEQMRRSRQSSLEWEYLASILDRILLIVFVISVILVTLGFMLTGTMAQWSYEEE